MMFTGMFEESAPQANEEWQIALCALHHHKDHQDKFVWTSVILCATLHTIMACGKSFKYSLSVILWYPNYVKNGKFQNFDIRNNKISLCSVNTEDLLVMEGKSVFSVTPIMYIFSESLYNIDSSFGFF